MKKILLLLFSILFVFCFAACGETTTENDDEIIEQKNWIVIKEPTCTESGLKRLGEGVDAQEETIPALGHDFGEYITISDALCEEEGIAERTCSRCGLKETQTIPANGHNISDKYFADQTHHWHECENCKEKFDIHEHSLGDFTEETFSLQLVPGSIDISRYNIVDNYKYIYSYTCEDCSAVIQEISTIDNTATTDFYYDDNYNLIKVISGNRQYDIRYNDNGSLEYIYEDHGDLLYLRVYNEEGWLKEVKVLNVWSSGTFEEIIEADRVHEAFYYDYDEDGNLCYLKKDASTFHPSDPNANDEILEWTYYIEGTIKTFKVTYTSTSNFIGYVDLERYDEHGTLIYISQEANDESFNSFREYRTEYNSNGLLSIYQQTAGTNFTDLLNIETYTYEFDNQNNIIKRYREKTRTNKNNYTTVYNYTDTYEYDENGNLIKSVIGTQTTNYSYNKYNSIVNPDGEYRWEETVILP